ncbi:MAG: hypothetical protein PHP44_03970 [Kiritimatiellae bacterium]|nr:hypothetical protein [Kiritimatiellia bacterium]
MDTDPFNGTFSLPIDLTDGGRNNSFSVVFSSAGGKSELVDSFNDVLLTVLIDGTLHQYDYDDEANAWFDENYAALSGGTPATFSMPFSSLGGGLDMTQVDAVCLHVCSENYDLEYSLDSFYTDGSGSDAVPEPGVAATFLTGGAMLCLLRRRLFRVSENQGI